jgi:hypothetical protein
MFADAMRGEDPVEVRKAARGATAIADLAADYLERHAVPKKRPKSVRDYRSMLEYIILPKLGAKKVACVGRRDLEAIHIAMRGPDRRPSIARLRIGWLDHRAQRRPPHHPFHLGKKRCPPSCLGIAFKSHCRQRQLLHPPTLRINPPRPALYHDYCS